MRLQGMTYNKDFDVDSVLELLRTVNEKYKEGSPEDEAIRVAAVALLYVRERQKLDDYREFFRKFYTLAADSIVPSHVFATSAEADEWLSSGKANEGELVKIAGEGFRVIPMRDAKGLRFRPTPLPEELDRMSPPDSE
jgi:hypothetical protein